MSSLTFGLHAVEALLKKQPERVKCLYVLEGRADKRVQLLLDIARANRIKVESLSRHALDQLVSNENHQGVAVLCEKLKNYSEEDLDQILETVKKPFFLILDGVQDPHNLGACLRTADAAGVHAVIAPRDKAASITPVVAKVASGAAENVPFIQVTNLARTMSYLKERGVWIYGASGDAQKNWCEIDFAGPIAIALGAEGTGLRRLTQEHCDVLAKIPMHGSVSSLNVSVAAGIFFV